MNSPSAVRSFAVLATLLFVGSANGAIKPLAITNIATPEGNGKFLIFSVSNATAPLLNNAGQVVFWASLSATSGGTSDDTGIYMYDGVALKNIARENGAAPGGANFDILTDVPSLNDAGVVAFDSSLRNAQNGIDNVGTYLNNGSALVKLARRGEGLPDGDGSFSQSDNTTVNAAGHVRIKASLMNTSSFLGIYLHNGSGLVKLARVNDAVPEGNGQFDDFSDFKQGFNDADQVAFQATLRNTSGGFNDNQGIYFHNGAALVNLARAGGNVPEGNGQFASFNGSALVNSSGKVAFSAVLRNTSGSSIDNGGVYLHNGTALVNIARENANVPEGDGRFGGFNPPLVNDAGQLAFYASLENTSSQTNSGIYRYSDGALAKIVREGANPPDGNGQYDSFSRLHMNNTGQIVFSAFMRNTIGGLTDDIAFYETDGIETVKVAREGDTVVGAVIAFLDTTGGYAGDFGLRKSFNDFGQVAFRAAAANGSQGIFLYTPELRWRSATSGSWDTAGNWTLSLKPGTPHDVSINPTTSLTVTGPASGAMMQSLTVGDNVGVAHPKLNLPAGSVVNASAAITLKDNATVGFAIGGTNFTDFARLTTGGSAALDGQLAVQLVNGFLPNAGDMFSILSATGGITGTFNTVANGQRLTTSDGLGSFVVNYGAGSMFNPNQVILSAFQSVGAFTANFDDDGDVDGDDLTQWRGDFGVNALSDANGDGDSDGADFLAWQQQFGGGSAVTAASASVPEPATFMLILAAAGPCAWRNRRRKFPQLANA